MNADNAIAKLEETISVASEYEIPDVAESAKELIPQVWMQKGNNALKVKDMETAIAAYTKVTEITPENGDAYIRLGKALSAIGKIDEAMNRYSK